MRRIAALTLGVVLCACTPGGDPSNAGPRAVTVDAADGEPRAGTAEPASDSSADDLEGVVWQLVEVREGGAVREVREPDHALLFDGKGRVGGRGCNWFGARVETSATRVEAEGFGSTLIGCGGVAQRLDGLTQETLTDGSDWALADGRLTLTGSKAVLVYEKSETPFRFRGVTPLVQDGDGPQVHRLGWLSVGTEVGVEWEAGKVPSLHTDVQGFRLAPDHRVRGLIPHNGQSDGRGFAFVATRPEHTRVEFVPRDGGAAVPLQAHVVPPAKTWRLFAGFVGPARSRGWIVAYDSSGREVMRSYEITV